MKTHSSNFRILGVVLLLLTVVSLAAAQEQPPDNVAGKWTIYSKGPTGVTATKFVEFQQQGNVLKGHFKGLYQSGGIEGSINVHHILFRTKTREVLTFRGAVNGNTITGSFHDRQGTGEWQAVRSE
jgi:hypothetical protein